MNYAKRFYIVWNGKRSQMYLMNAALKLARKMRARGHTVTVMQS